MPVIRSAFIAVLSFAAGVCFIDTAWGWAHRMKAEQMAEQIRKCNGKGWEYVIRASGPDCVALQGRFEPWWPIRDPMKLRRREIKQAIHSEPKEKS